MTLTVLKPTGGIDGTEIRMDGGLGYFELQTGSDPAHIQVRFGDAVVMSTGFTVLRVDMDNAPGELAVFSGNAHVERGSAVSIDMHGGESLTLSNSSASQYNLAETIEPDSWDSWNSDRDQLLTALSASKTEATSSFVNNANPAWNDLDANGNWYNVPGTGYVWSPYDASSPGWDPWGNGYWMMTPRFGYMWVSGDSWGYMPFNCGAWNFYDGFGWGWGPGAGACMPWWNSGFWGPNYGILPIGFLPPHRPIRLPRGGNPTRPGGRFGPYPLIAVNKRPPSGSPGAPGRGRTISATINGHVVMPVRTLSPRPAYDHSVAGNGSQTGPGAPGMRAPNGTLLSGGGTGTHGAAPRPASGAHVSAPSHASAPAPAPHVSSGGGGGGGGAHASSGGGGGGHH
jgi:hypothetical protein